MLLFRTGKVAGGRIPPARGERRRHTLVVVQKLFEQKPVIPFAVNEAGAYDAVKSTVDHPTAEFKFGCHLRFPQWSHRSGRMRFYPWSMERCVPQKEG